MKPFVAVARGVSPWRRWMVLAAGLLVAGLMLSDAQASASAKKTSKAKPAKTQKAKPSADVKRVVITGSYIPEKIEPGKRLVTSSPVVIIDMKQVRRSGASTVSQALTRLPTFR